MNIYKVFNPKWSDETPYDVFDTFIVICRSAERASQFNPEFQDAYWDENLDRWRYMDNNILEDRDYSSDWCKPSETEVTLLGKAEPEHLQGIVLKSFNAG